VVKILKNALRFCVEELKLLYVRTGLKAGHVVCDCEVRSEYLELCKTLNVLYSKCERCTDPVRIGKFF